LVAQMHPGGATSRLADANEGNAAPLRASTARSVAPRGNAPSGSGAHEGDAPGSTPDQIPADEYARWLEPAALLGLFADSLSEDERRRAIMRRLGDGVLRSAAQRVVRNGRPTDYGELSRDDWHGWGQLDQSALWNIGDYVRIVSDATGYDRREDTRLRAYGVRLDPQTIAAGFPQLLSAAPEELLLRMLPVSFDTLMSRGPNPEVGPNPPGPLAPRAVQISRAPPPITPLVGYYSGAPAPEPYRHVRTMDSAEATRASANTAARLAATDPPVPRQRNPERKAVSGLPYVPDHKLTAWYQKHYAAHPDDVYRVVRPKADKRFQGKYRVGKNQLYEIMSAVQGGLKVGKR